MVECAANWALGGTLDARAVLVLLELELAFGAAGGALVALLTGVASAPALVLALSVVYGFLRVYEPPGVRAELLYALVAPAAAVLALRLGRGRGGALAFVQLALLATAATVFGKAGITEVQSYFAQEEPSALTLVVLLAGLPVAGVLADRLLAFVVRRDAVRLGLEVAAAGLALLVWGHPMPTAALDQPVAGRVPFSPGAPDVILVTLDTTRADHMSTYGYARDTSPNLTALARDALNFTHAVARRVERSPARLDADRHVPEPPWRALRGRLGCGAGHLGTQACLPAGRRPRDGRRGLARPRLSHRRLRRQLREPLSWLRDGAGFSALRGSSPHPSPPGSARRPLRATPRPDALQRDTQR
jgi:hypothetical protein